MAAAAGALGAEAVLLLGDNFYTHGVETSTSSRFRDTFEAVYPPSLFRQLPFYVVAGNHDHRGNVQAQIDYHGSPRWHFPALYYTLRWNFTSSSGAARAAEIVMIDTVSLAGLCLAEEEYPGCPLEFAAGAEEDAGEEQWAWLAQQIDASTADFLWVAGHYPIYSAGSDGTTAVLVQRLLPMLRQAEAHYISGHDHMLEHIESDGVNMFVTGPGRECCYDATHNDTVPAGDIKFMISGPNGQGPSVGPKPESDMLSGFSSLQFDDAVATTFYKEDGTVLYRAPPIPARSARARSRQPGPFKEEEEARQ